MMKTWMDWLQTHLWQVATTVVLAGGLWLLYGSLSGGKAFYDGYRQWRQGQAEVSTAVAWEQEKADLDVQRDRLQRRLETLSIRLPRQDQVSRILQVFQTQAQAAGVVLAEVRPGEAAMHEGYAEKPFALVLRGPFHSLGTFIAGLEQAPYLVVVDGWRLLAGNDTGTAVNAEIHLHIISPVQGPEADR